MTEESKLEGEGAYKESQRGDAERIEWSGGVVCNGRRFGRDQVGFEDGYLGVEVREVIGLEGSGEGNNAGREAPRDAEVTLAIVNDDGVKIAVGKLWAQRH